MVKLRVKIGAKGQVVIPKVIREKLGIGPGRILLIDEKNGKIVIEKFDVDEFIDWVKRTRRKIAKDVYRFSLEDEFQ
ncbi:MAG: AbrB/MazE/SpoVT family DNA-binding domain-containing protein [Archaeoglobaceae archaeon]|nr:AbrB/MazE/SpoVT family DNA-binding domain-containing protein [Archaeoglobaceae archaeon]